MLPLVLDLLLIDESNPRSIAFQLARSRSHIDTLPQSGAGGGRIEEQRMALSLLTSVRLADVAALARSRRTAPAQLCRSCWTSRSRPWRRSPT